MKELEANQIIQAFEHMVKNADNHIPITGKMLLEDLNDYCSYGERKEE